MRHCRGFAPWALITVLVSGLAWPAAAAAEKRVALVIGNGKYLNAGELGNPANDARLMADTLRQVGFEVIERIDADQKIMKRAIKDFGDALNAAGNDAVGLFYYAGHGVQVGRTNYLIPVNVDIKDEGDVEIEAVSADVVQRNMAFAGNRMNIIIMDACRNNPFKRSFRSAAQGLAKMEATAGTLIAYATAPGAVAADGKGRNSPYTEALSRALRIPGIAVERVFKEVRNQVVSVTNGQQVPWESSSLTGADFFFTRGLAVKGTGPSADTVAWQSIQSSTSPAEFTAFMQSFPDSPFVAMAEGRLKALAQRRQTAALAVPPQPKSAEWPANLDRLLPGPSNSPVAAALPEQVRVMAPGPDVPKDQGAFSGIWHGWMCKGKITDQKLAVVHIDKNGAAIIFARGRAGTKPLRRRLRGEFVGDELRATMPNGAELFYKLRADGHMNTKLIAPSGGHCTGVLARQ